MASKRFAILASGKGSNAKNLITYAKDHGDKFTVEVVITDRENSMVIEVAKNLGVPVEVIPFSKTDGKKTHEEKILNSLRKYNVSWLALAGYMRILSAEFLEKFYDQNLGVNRVLNVHPSLLPNFPGKDGYKDAYTAGVSVSGVTIHFVDSGVDSGPILLQRSFEREPKESLENFISKGQKVEHELYREAIKKVAEDRI